MMLHHWRRLHAIVQLNIYFTILRVYCMLILNYFTTPLHKNNTTLARASAAAEVAHTPCCTGSVAKCGGAAAATANAARLHCNQIPIKHASSNWKRNSNSNSNSSSSCNCNIERNKNVLTARSSLSLATAATHSPTPTPAQLVHDFGDARRLICAHFTKHLISMQIALAAFFATYTATITTATAATAAATATPITTTLTKNAATTATTIIKIKICTNTCTSTTNTSTWRTCTSTTTSKRARSSDAGGSNFLHVISSALAHTARLQGICIIRLISLKRILQIPTQQSCVFLKQMHNYVSNANCCRTAADSDDAMATCATSRTTRTRTMAMATPITTKTALAHIQLRVAAMRVALKYPLVQQFGWCWRWQCHWHWHWHWQHEHQHHQQHHHHQHHQRSSQAASNQMFVLTKCKSSSSGITRHTPRICTTASIAAAYNNDHVGAIISWQRHGQPLLHRTLIVLILLSSLWHGTECFHGSVKLSANTVKSKYGLLRGIVVRSSPLVEAFLGIPYASPPVGSLRFMPPITPSTWKNVRNADRFSAVCPQTVPIPPNGPEALLEVPRARLAQLRRLLPLLNNQSEDCLYLNIYVPYENRRQRRSTSSTENYETAKLSTVLLIHGESYEWNSGNPYDGSELAAHGNVIVVTINFRLGIFGFLKTGGKESAQGNFGLMDLVAGLHWLKENLPAFGGDPQSITIMGHSSGAALANILVVSPVASDLVQRAIMVSGSALSPWAIQKNPLFVKRRVAEQTGCHGDMLYDDLAPCLRTKSVAELLAVKIDHPRFLSGFSPFVDGTVISPKTDPVGELSLPLGSAIVSTSGIEFANFPKRDLIFCLTSVESYLDLSAQDLEFGFNETRRDRILRTFVRNNFHYHLNEIFAVLKNEYTDWEKAIRSPLSSRDATLSFLSDGHTASALIKLGYMHSLRGGRSYFLHFKHKTIEEEYPQRTGSVRGEDVPFWLGLPISPLFPHNYTTQEKQISRLMLHYLANFAKTGNPNHSGSETPSMSASTSRSPATPNHNKVKRASLKSNSLNKFINLTAAHAQHGNLGTTESLNLAVLYNQRRSNVMRDRRAYYKRHMRSNNNNNNNGNNNNESYELKGVGRNADEPIHGERLPFWDAYDVVNQLYLELGNKAEVQSHYRGHKLSMWLNLIPQLHKHSNINDQSMRHHQFPDDNNNRDLYEGVVRPQLQTKPHDDEDTIIVKLVKTTVATKVVTLNASKTGGNNVLTGATTTECSPEGTLLAGVVDLSSTQSPAATSDNRSLLVEGGQKDLATASTGIIGNLEVLRRLSGKQFQSYTTALVATVAVGCFLLTLNILIFAGIYHQREKRARDAKTKEELQDTDTNSKNSSILKLNAVGGDDASAHFDSVSGKTTVVFGEYNCYDEKSKTGKEEKLLVELPPLPTPQTNVLLESSWPPICSASTLDLLKTKHHNPLEAAGYSSANEAGDMHLHPISSIEMATYNALPIGGGGGVTLLESAVIQGRRSSFAAASTSQSAAAQFDYAVQSSDQMCFKEIEDAVKASADDIVHDVDDDIPEPPPPPRSFQSVHHQQQQQQQQQSGILRPSGSNTVSTSSGKKRVHIQEISV